MNILIISFDIIKVGECSISYSIASLLAALKFKTNEKINIVQWSFNIIESCFRQELKDKISSNNLNEYDKIAMSVFVWSEWIVKELLESINFIKYKGTIILGGRQIIGEKYNLKNDYPLCKIFVIGYGENCIKKAVFSNNYTPIFLYGNCDELKNVPSPYITNELNVIDNQEMVRMETKRGCPYSCSFCAHRDLSNNKVCDFPYTRIISELNLFKQKNVGKINIIDPVFNTGNKYIDILEYIYNKRIDSLISIQVRFEQIKGEEGEKFIDLCSKVNIVLELGIQSLIEKEWDIINRRNDINNIEKVIRTLNKKKIKYETSLIYGLPEQSLSTFQKTISHLQSMGCEKIKKYPLMLLKGTKLYNEKEKWGLKERIFEDNIPIVVESNSFSEEEWNKMKQTAEQSE
jgi:radical SAM superfamily enzyme YgiQ (UPF0313 family)